ncbi:MAG TPA: extracellular solute-binding protein [Herbaspirillum sp.]|jgi:iron(III) transport system substrate-binding protein
MSAGKNLFKLVSFLSAVFLFLCLSPARAQTAQAQVDAAEKEGAVVWYTALSTPEADTVRQLFQKKYPSIKLTVLRQPGEKVRTRILSEAQAGKTFWDVVSINHLDIDALNQEGLLASYVSPEGKAGFPPGAIDPNGRFSGLYMRQFVIAYNTQLVAPAKAPKDWADLLEPQWKGLLAMDESDIEWYASMLEYFGRDKGLALMRGLAQQKPQIRRGHTLLMALLKAGDYSLALVLAHEVEKAKKEGAPVDWVKTLDPIVTSPSQVSIAAKAQHPNAARVLVDFLLSVEGQSLLKQFGRTPARALDSSGSANGGLKIHFVNPKLFGEFTKDEQEFKEIFLNNR